MILLRHGQSEFNLHFSATRRDPGLIDPVLTQLGHAQAAAAAEALAGEAISRVIVSPYTRTLQTAAPLLDQRGMRPEIVPLVRERFAFKCDIGSAPAVLAERFPGHVMDHLPAQWWPEERESEAGVIERADAFRALMMAADDWRETVLISHWGFILALTGQSLMNGQWIRFDPHAPRPETIIWHP
ncbi:MAG TPA: histidine phosphatase family protein [Acidiphilium sp.]|nr:MAG: histidine phosphatase family protein [Acidiphilium sp. 21-60-14]OYV91939.1 MAG: histidine phosphatase family protein [Acidiphilium sp. 37-60-79]OZB39157.1 MAG: histidine phosphatase family protein [Acidiphilium sp. 34-60-192]HQT88357.1 histidine phosphatase family protein [Acidiphilium sp.]HQU25025.1 histidine phosphatase family protein [Acidiphilium sp.]